MHLSNMGVRSMHLSDMHLSNMHVNNLHLPTTEVAAHCLCVGHNDRKTLLTFCVAEQEHTSDLTCCPEELSTCSKVNIRLAGVGSAT